MTPRPLFFDAEQAQQFLTRLMGEDVDGVFEIRAFEESEEKQPPKARLWFDTPDEPLSKVAALVERRLHTYVGIAPRRNNKSGAKANLLYTEWLFAEQDFKDFDGTQEEKEQAAWQFVAKYPRQPAMTIQSGGGLQHYWPIDRLDLTSPESIARYESVLKQLASEIHGDESVAEAARVLRLPGTWNVKAKYGDPRRVKIESSTTTRVYDLSDFPSLPEPERTPPTQTTRPKTTGSNVPTVDELTRRALDVARSRGRNNGGLFLATQMRDNGYCETEAESAMTRYQASCPSGDEPFTLQEALSIVPKAYKRPAREAWSGSDDWEVIREAVDEADETEEKAKNDDFQSHGFHNCEISGEPESCATMLKVRKAVLSKKLKGIAEVETFGGLRFNSETKYKHVTKAAQELTFLYGRIDDTRKWDLIDTYCRALDVNPQAAKMQMKQELFGRFARQVGNWISEIGHDFAFNRDGRRRPKLPLWLHGEVRDLTPEQQEDVFDTFEDNGYIEQESVQKLILDRYGVNATAQQKRGKTDAQSATPGKMETPGFPAWLINLIGPNVDRWEEVRKTRGEEWVETQLEAVLSAGLEMQSEQSQDADSSPHNTEGRIHGVKSGYSPLYPDRPEYDDALIADAIMHTMSYTPKERPPLRLVDTEETPPAPPDLVSNRNEVKEEDAFAESSAEVIEEIRTAANERGIVWTSELLTNLLQRPVQSVNGLFRRLPADDLTRLLIAVHEYTPPPAPPEARSAAYSMQGGG
jgi:hypothetical protein